MGTASAVSMVLAAQAKYLSSVPQGNEGVDR